MPKRKANDRPIVGKVPRASKPVATGVVPAARQWAFSFRYLRQIDLFGTGNKDASWFVSVFEKIADLCTKQVDDVISSPAEKRRWRLHEIDWNHRGIPIAKGDLTWVDKKYLENDEEFPFWQFSVSTALGRVIGFWDECGIFNLVLLDPSHNLQPAKYSDYKTREAPIGKGEFETAICLIESRISHCGEDCRCRELYSEIQASLTNRLEFSAMLVAMPQELFDKVCRLIQSGVANSVSDLLDVALADFEGCGAQPLAEENPRA